MRQVWLSTMLMLVGLEMGGPVASAREPCAWVLWQKAGREPGAWEVLNSYTSREQCQDKLKKYTKKFAGPTDMIDVDGNRATITDVSGLTVFRVLLCLPDRLYPSVPLR